MPQEPANFSVLLFCRKFCYYSPVGGYMLKKKKKGLVFISFTIMCLGVVFSVFTLYSL